MKSALAELLDRVGLISMGLMLSMPDNDHVNATFGFRDGVFTTTLPELSIDKSLLTFVVEVVKRRLIEQEGLTEAQADKWLTSLPGGPIH